MGKRERKLEVINKYLPKCTNTWTVYTYGSIPRKCFEGACSSYASAIEEEDAWGLIDETIFGSGKKGMIFTCDGFYFSESTGFFRYKDNISFNSLGSSYNITAMNEMLAKLYEIESEPSGWDIAASLFGGALGILQEIAAEGEETPENAEDNNNTLD